MLQHSLAWAVVELAVFVVFGVGVLANLIGWLRATRWARQRGVTGLAAVVARDHAMRLLRPRLFGRFVLDSFLQWRLLRISRSRWLAHSLLVWGNLLLFCVGSLGLMLADKGLLSITKDTPWFSLVNEVAGLMVLGGIALSLRRYDRAAKQPAIRSREGLAWLILLGIVALSGYVLKSARLVADRVAPDVASSAIVSAPLAQGITMLVPQWSVMYPALWWFHAIVAMAMVAAIPYGRLFHMVASPIVIAIDLVHTHEREPRSARIPRSIREMARARETR